jgi:predicted tellurium resistance membrane protein TerC
MWVLRRILMQMGTVDAMQFLLDKMKDAKSNEDFFASMNQYSVRPRCFEGFDFARSSLRRAWPSSADHHRRPHMAGDNVVIMGSLASGLPRRTAQGPDARRRMALVFLITFAVLATQLLKITGLVFAGGCCCCGSPTTCGGAASRRASSPTIPTTPAIEGPPRAKTFLQAAIQITIADLSMSLDNVLLVASIARENPALLFIGLSFSVSSWACGQLRRAADPALTTGSTTSAWRSSCGSPANMIYEAGSADEMLGLRACSASARADPWISSLIHAASLPRSRDPADRHRPCRRQCDRRRRARCGLPAEQRSKVIMLGVAAALVLRIAFALVVTSCSDRRPHPCRRLPLLWVAWKMWRELRHAARARLRGDRRRRASGCAREELRQRAWGVALADVSMSLDNVLAVPGRRASIRGSWCSA